MTYKEKLDKLAAEIERRINKLNKPFYTPDTPCGIALQTYKEVLAILDTMQEEPTNSVWHDISEKPKMNSIIVMNNDQTTLSVEYCGQSLCGVERWAYIDDLLKL